MLKHVIYGSCGLLAASIIALAIYLDKPAPELLGETAAQEEVAGDTQVAAVGASGGGQDLYEVSKVIDGDTISIQKGGATETVRMIGLNAPETGQCYTSEATQKLKSLVASGRVRLELDASQGERDKYDRLLAYVFAENGINTAKALIEGGFAKEYTYSKPYTYQAEFKTAQASAQASGKGVWAAGACAAPASAPPPAQAAAVTAPAIKKVEPVPVKKEPVKAAQEEPEQEEEEDEPPPVKSSGSYTCSSNTYNCTDFATHTEAQAVFDACGGASNDIHKLDANKDGQACESLP